MNRKTAYAILSLVVIAAVLLVFAFSQPGTVDAAKIFSAAQAYTRDLQRQGISVPPTVQLKELIDRKLLKPEDVSGFAGAEVTVSLTADPNDPRAVLIRARFPDGQEIVMLTDGTVR